MMIHDFLVYDYKAVNSFTTEQINHSFSLAKIYFHCKMKKQFSDNLEWKCGMYRSKIKLHILCSLILIHTVHKSSLFRHQ